MGRRRALYKMKVQLPVDDPDSESNTESEKKAGDSDSTNFSEGNSSGGEESVEDGNNSDGVEGATETKPPKGGASSDSGSSGDSDLEETFRSRLRKLTKKSIPSLDVSSSDESSGTEDEQPRERKIELKSEREDGDSSSVEELSSSDSDDDDSDLEEVAPKESVQSSSGDEDSALEEAVPKESGQYSSGDEDTSDVEVAAPRESGRSSSGGEDSSDVEEEEVTNRSVKIEGEAKDVDEESEASDEETEDDEQNGSETDSEEEWGPQEEAEEDAKSDDLDDLVEESEIESGDEWDEDALQNEAKQTDSEDAALCSASDLRQAKFITRTFMSRVPLVEETAICRGEILSGPPLEFATTHSDEYARKFRWPQHIRNLRKTDFSQDPSEIWEDYEVVPEIQQSRSGQGEKDTPQESAFAQVPRPLVALAAEALRRSSRKRKRSAENEAGPSEKGPSAATLLNIARVGGQFGDHYVESLLTANARALQGIDDGFDYDKRCWSSLPTKKKPIANWRFVLEHVRRTMGVSDDFPDALYPPMKQETLERITQRLKKLYGHTTQLEEYDIFEQAMPSSSENDEAK
ncbi:hypothetical protein PF005_g12683 [Phytophthora fragariae]|uniref:Uncharacterized protein n=2 Tax=Phytophthora fragariae TaxID=53985 RepID=A0A6A3IXR6_9STRA|nr:hypothetical protein PF003_g20093 [Phytophthora fragariae]KAE8936407.1 hypothetical protein PF009_g13677 [Phytophthora fragariae]KAE8985798.1 hypothetical protein PF011_g20247 [Phytophthora fragariae]KAE9108210.1 hypothetical protein PF010_g11991 [Phytophthora fragariae]KAE9111440.1 hypothetical protein PF007_g11485 [Phytophthora fragariae]